MGAKAALASHSTGEDSAGRSPVEGINAPIAAGLHIGGPFSTGPVIATLGRHYKPVGCTTISYDAVAAVGGCRCGNVYVDVQTRKFPKGAIRGRLNQLVGGSR